MSEMDEIGHEMDRALRVTSPQPARSPKRPRDASPPRPAALRRPPESRLG